MHIIHKSKIGSTNDVAKQLARTGYFGPLWIYADQQTSGRGRLDRIWISQKGNLFCTGLYPHDTDIKSAALFSYVAALALVDVLSGFIKDAKITIKWPNDVLVAGQKIAGILLETGRTNSQQWLVVGMGVNVLSCPDIAGTTKLAAHMGRAVPSPKTLLLNLIDKYQHRAGQYQRFGFEHIRQAWLKNAHGLGAPVRANRAGETIQGVAIGLDKGGALEIRTHRGRVEKIHAGDVFFSDKN